MAARPQQYVRDRRIQVRGLLLRRGPATTEVLIYAADLDTDRTRDSHIPKLAPIAGGWMVQRLICPHDVKAK